MTKETMTLQAEIAFIHHLLDCATAELTAIEELLLSRSAIETLVRDHTGSPVPSPPSDTETIP